MGSVDSKIGLQAAQSGDWVSVRQYILRGGDVNARDDGGNSLIHMLIVPTIDPEENETVLELLLQRGADPNVKSGASGVTPLYVAAKCGRASVCEMLLRHGADVNTRQGTGDTALHIAARWGHSACVDVLLWNGADPLLLNSSGVTAMECARNRGNTDVVSKLQPVMDQVALLQTYTAPATTSSRVLDAVRAGNVQKLQQILQQEPQNARAKDFATHWTALHECCVPRGSGWRSTAARLLLQLGADVNAQTKDEYDVWKHHETSSDLLTSIPVTISLTFPAGTTPLHVAAAHGVEAACKLLLLNGARVNAKNKRQETPFFVAALCGQLDTCKMLISNGADVNARNEEDRSTLQVLREGSGLDECYEPLECHRDVIDYILSLREGGTIVDDTLRAASPVSVTAGSPLESEPSPHTTSPTDRISFRWGLRTKPLDELLETAAPPAPLTRTQSTAVVLPDFPSRNSVMPPPPVPRAQPVYMRIPYKEQRGVALQQYDEEPPGYITCPISFEIMQDPVVTPTGYTYERANIVAEIQRSGLDPQTRAPLSQSDLRPNRQLAEAIAAWTQQHSMRLEQQRQPQLT